MLYYKYDRKKKLNLKEEVMLFAKVINERGNDNNGNDGEPSRTRLL
jgi:hypothetical protein